MEYKDIFGLVEIIPNTRMDVQSYNSTFAVWQTVVLESNIRICFAREKGPCIVCHDSCEWVESGFGYVGPRWPSMVAYVRQRRQLSSWDGNLCLCEGA